jgi:hypothetical protein
MMMLQKRLSWAVLALLCLFLPSRTLAQPVAVPPLKSNNDQIIIALGGENRLVVPVQSVKQLDHLSGINALVKRLNADLAAATDTLFDNKYAKTVLYRETSGGGRTLKVNTKAEERTELYVEKGSGLIKTLQRMDSIAVTLQNEQPLFFILDSVQVMQRLGQTDFDGLIGQMSLDIETELERQRKKNLIAYRGPREAVYENEKDGKRKLVLRAKQIKLDQISLFFNTGAGLVRDKLVPEIGLGVALLQNRRGTRYFGLTGSMHYFFDRLEDGKYKMSINTFVTLELAQTFSREGKVWQKVGIGYLVSEQGGYFGKNTFKLTLDLAGKPRHGALHLIPELIFTDNFKTIFPGVRVGVGF